MGFNLVAAYYRAKFSAIKIIGRKIVAHSSTAQNQQLKFAEQSLSGSSSSSSTTTVNSTTCIQSVPGSSGLSKNIYNDDDDDDDNNNEKKEDYNLDHPVLYEKLMPIATPIMSKTPLLRSLCESVQQQQEHNGMMMKVIKKEDKL